MSRSLIKERLDSAGLARGGVGLTARVSTGEGSKHLEARERLLVCEN